MAALPRALVLVSERCFGLPTNVRGVLMSARHRIAVVDDDHSVRRALCRLLRSVDLDASAYGSGREFLEALSTSPPDCLVLDLRMPDMNGLEVQRCLTENGFRVPVVMITGHDEPGMQAKCILAGASTYLRKPLDEQSLLGAIEQAIALLHNQQS
jgi:FixJ family two-component response regulator